MKAWIKFLLVPLFTLVLFSLIESLIMGFVFRVDPNGWASWISGFIVMWFAGGQMFLTAPAPRIPLAIIYAALMSGISIWADLVNDGQVTHFSGQSVHHEFDLGGQISIGLGLLLGIATMWYAELQQRSEQELGHG